LIKIWEDDEAINRIFENVRLRYGKLESSSYITRRLEDTCGTNILAHGFLSDITDDKR
jgi:hypothetical protein